MIADQSLVVLDGRIKLQVQLICLPQTEDGRQMPRIARTTTHELAELLNRPIGQPRLVEAICRSPQTLAVRQIVGQLHRPAVRQIMLGRLLVMSRRPRTVRFIEQLQRRRRRRVLVHSPDLTGNLLVRPRLLQSQLGRQRVRLVQPGRQFEEVTGLFIPPLTELLFLLTDQTGQHQHPMPATQSGPTSHQFHRRGVTRLRLGWRRQARFTFGLTHQCLNLPGGPRISPGCVLELLQRLDDVVLGKHNPPPPDVHRAAQGIGSPQRPLRIRIALFGTAQVTDLEVRLAQQNVQLADSFGPLGVESAYPLQQHVHRLICLIGRDQTVGLTCHRPYPRRNIRCAAAAR